MKDCTQVMLHLKRNNYFYFVLFSERLIDPSTTEVCAAAGCDGGGPMHMAFYISFYFGGKRTSTTTQVNSIIIVW